MAGPVPAPALVPEPLVPPLALGIFIACAAGGAALANCAVLAALLKRSRNGKPIVKTDTFQVLKSKYK